MAETSNPRAVDHKSSSISLLIYEQLYIYFTYEITMIHDLPSTYYGSRMVWVWIDVSKVRRWINRIWLYTSVIGGVLFFSLLIQEFFFQEGRSDEGQDEL